MNLELGFALALYGLLLVPLLLLLGRKSQFLLSPKRRVIVVALRVLVVTLVVLAVADVRIGLPTDDLAVATVIDSSASIADGERASLEAQLEALRVTNAEVEFSTIIAPHQQSRADASTSPPELATAITTAAATLPQNRVRRMIVATDGRDVDDDVLGAIRDAASGGVRVDVLPLGAAPPIDALALSAIQVPRLVRAGETLEVALEVSAGRSAQVELIAEIDGQEVATDTASVSAGDGRVSLSVPFPGDEGIHRLEITTRTPGDIVSANDRITTLVRVLTKPRVLHLHDEDSSPPLARALEEAELDVTSMDIGAAPSTLVALDRYGLIVLDEVDPERLSEPQQLAIRRFVEELGGGLVTITGGHPVKRSPEIIRQLEPIRPAPAIPEPRPLELVLVIDRSGSMEGARISMARRAGVAAITALRADALVGVVAFSGGADRVMAPVPVLEDENRAFASNFVARINAGGGTNIAAALGSARAIMSTDPRYIHHVILLSDGASAPGPALAQAQALASGGVSISAITIGPRNPLMAEIARIGRGRYHVTENPGSLPALFVREAQFRQPPAHRTGRITPRVATPHRALRDIDFGGAPPLGGHGLAETRPLATTILETSRGEPLLSHWYRGVGQVASFTSATTGGWADGWRGSQVFHTFWSQLAWSLMRPRTVDPLELRFEEIPGVADRVRVIAVAPTVDASPVPEVRIHRPGLDTAGPAVDDPGVPLELEALGPGIFAGEVAIAGGFLAVARMPRDPEPTASMAYDRSYEPELARFGHDDHALAELAELGGGTVLGGPQRALENVEESPVSTPLAIWLFLAALLSYLLSVLLLRLPDDAAAKAAAAKIARPSRWSGPPDEPKKKTRRRRWTPGKNGKSEKDGSRREAA